MVMIGMLYVASEADVALLGDAQAHLLLRASGSLQQRLAAIAAGSVLNLAPLSAAVLADVFVPAMLPLDWRSALESDQLFGLQLHAVSPVVGPVAKQGMAPCKPV